MIQVKYTIKVNLIYMLQVMLDWKAACFLKVITYVPVWCFWFLVKLLLYLSALQKNRARDSGMFYSVGKHLDFSQEFSAVEPEGMSAHFS